MHLAAWAGRGRTLAPAAAAVALLGVGRIAQALTCTMTDPTTTVCRAVLSAPRVFTVRGSARAVAGQPAPAGMTLLLNGRACASGGFGFLSGRSLACHAALPAGETVVAVHTNGPAATTVAFVPNRSLAALPREARALEPNRRPLPFWARYWPF